MKLNKVHEDNRRSIHVLEGLLPDNKEFSIINLKADKAIGGCMHTMDEHYIILDGAVRVWCGEDSFPKKNNETGLFPAHTPHAFIALVDSIIVEWGVPEDEKRDDNKDAKMREAINKLNE